jgi:exodeoxyribonuclease I
LELLTAANGLAHEAAHDALSDVRATVALARLVKTAQPALWDFCLKLRRKEGVQAEMGVNRPFVHLSGMYGVERGCAAIVWPLAPHPTNKNEVIVWDLSADPSELDRLDVESARRRMFTRADDLPEGETRLPIKTIHINKSPVVIGNLKTLGSAVQRFGIDLPLALQHAERAAALPNLDALWGDVFKRPVGDTVPDVDEDLYGGFVNNEDRRTLNRLLQLTPDQLASKQPAFADARLEEVFFRYRARNFPTTLSEPEHERWEQHRAQRLHEGVGGGQTLEGYLERIDTLAQAADERGDERASALLEALVDYAEGIAPER